MRLFEAIVEANHRAVDGDRSAGLHPADFADELPIVALTCVDPRLNAFFPNVLGVPADQFIWLRNAGNIIFDPMSSMTRTLALACAVKGGREIAIIGHTDCQVGKMTPSTLLERLSDLGVNRAGLPENLIEFFGIFGSERQNVIKACGIVRHSPLIGPKIPIHGLVVDVETGRLDWILNGYDTLGKMTDEQPGESAKSSGPASDLMKSLSDFHIGEMKFPDAKIGDVSGNAEGWLEKKIGEYETKIGGAAHPAPPAQPAKPEPAAPPPPPVQKQGMPPRIRPRLPGRR